MYRSTVSIVDLHSGKVLNSPADTPTFDVPADFDRTAGVASVDTRARAHYLSTTGKTLVNLAQPRPLSWRARGEECLVAGTLRGEETPYRLCAVASERR